MRNRYSTPTGAIPGRFWMSHAGSFSGVLAIAQRTHTGRTLSGSKHDWCSWTARFAIKYLATPHRALGRRRRSRRKQPLKTVPSIAPPPQFFVGTQPSKSSLDDWSYDEPAVTEKTTHDTPEKKKRRTNRDNWASGKRVFKPHQKRSKRRYARVKTANATAAN